MSGEAVNRRTHGRGWLAVFTMLVAPALVAAVGGLAWQQGGLNDELVSSAADLDEVSQRLDALEQQLTNLETETSGNLDELGTALDAALEDLSEDDVATVTERALQSVFTIDAGQNLGSGFAARRDGATTVVVTNYHVVEGIWEQGDRQVTLRREDASWPGTITDVSVSEDLAAIRMDAGFDPLPLARRTPEVAAQVIVIGSPFGLEGTVTTGVVSAHRSGVMQISAPISPGNSGGPVLTSSGEVVGVATWMIAGMSAQGLGFAAPVETVCRTVLDC